MAQSSYYPGDSKKTLFLVLVILVLVCAGAGVLLYLPYSKANFIPTSWVVIPSHPPVRVDVYKMNKKGAVSGVLSDWALQPPGEIYKENDLFHLKCSVDRECFVYILYRAKDPESKVLLMYPSKPVEDTSKLKGNSFTIPGDTDEQVDEKQHKLVGFRVSNSPGLDTFLVLASPVKLDIFKGKDGKQMSQKGLKSIFKSAENLLGSETFDSVNGIESLLVSQNSNEVPALIPDGMPGPKPANAVSIFINRCRISHIKP